MQIRYRLKSAMKLFCCALLVAAAFTRCQTGEAITRICEDNNTECVQTCVINNSNFSQTRLATQPVGECDKRCEANYQACMKRQQNKAVRGTASY